MSKQELEESRRKEVFKSNVLVQRGKHRFSNQQQKIIAYICSNLDTNKKKQEYIFEITDFMNVCGISKEGRTWKNIKSDIQRLSDCSWWVPLRDEKGEYYEKLVRFLQEVEIRPESGSIKIEINRFILPELIGLKENFMKYNLYNVLALTGDYAITLYEEFKSREAIGYWKINVEDFKKGLSISELKLYKKWYEVKRKIIEPCIANINKYTDLDIEYKDNGSRGRKATQICFVINSKEPINRMITEKLVYKTLDSGNEILEDDEFADFINSKKKQYNAKKIKTRPMTDKEKMDYNNLVENSKQMGIEDFNF